MAPRRPKKVTKKSDAKLPGKTTEKTIEKSSTKRGPKTSGKKLAKKLEEMSGKMPAKTPEKAPGRSPRKAPVSNVRDYDMPVRMETNRQIPLDCLLPYLAMGFTSQDTPGSQYQCGAYALAMSFNAAHALLRQSETIPDPDNPTASPKVILDFPFISHDDIIDILGSPEYQAEVDVYLQTHDPPTNLNAVDQRQRKKDMFRKDWLDHMQLQCVLAILNRVHYTDFVLGIITGGWQGRLTPDTAMWDPNFLKLTDPTLPTDGEERANRLVVWLIYNNVNVKEHAQRGTRHRQDHWEGFAPPSSYHRSTPQRVSEVQNYRVGGQVDEDIKKGVFIAIQNLASKLQDSLDAQAGAFLRPATAPGRRKSRRQGAYMRACNGAEGYVIQSQVRAIVPHSIRPSAATDAVVAVANRKRVIQLEQASETGNSPVVVEDPSEPGDTGTGTLTKIRFFFTLGETDLQDLVPDDHETRFPIQGLQFQDHMPVIGSTTAIPNPNTQGSEAIWIVDGLGRKGYAWSRRLGVVKPPFGLKDELFLLKDEPRINSDSDLNEVKAAAKSLGIRIARKNKTQLILEVNDAIAVRNAEGYGLKFYQVHTSVGSAGTRAIDLQTSVPMNAPQMVLQCGGKVAKQGYIRVRDYYSNELEVPESYLTLMVQSAWSLRLGRVTGEGYPFLPAANAIKSPGDVGGGNGGEGGIQDVEMGDSHMSSGGGSSNQVSSEEPSSEADGDVRMGGSEMPRRATRSMTRPPPYKGAIKSPKGKTRRPSGKYW